LRARRRVDMLRIMSEDDPALEEGMHWAEVHMQARCVLVGKCVLEAGIIKLVRTRFGWPRHAPAHIRNLPKLSNRTEFCTILDIASTESQWHDGSRTT
jgi:hypothetical protein